MESPHRRIDAAEAREEARNPQWSLMNQLVRLPMRETRTTGTWLFLRPSSPGMGKRVGDSQGGNVLRGGVRERVHRARLARDEGAQSALLSLLQIAGTRG